MPIWPFSGSFSQFGGVHKLGLSYAASKLPNLESQESLFVPVDRPIGTGLSSNVFNIPLYSQFTSRKQFQIRTLRSGIQNLNAAKLHTFYHLYMETHSGSLISSQFASCHGNGKQKAEGLAVQNTWLVEMCSVWCTDIVSMVSLLAFSSRSTLII